MTSNKIRVMVVEENTTEREWFAKGLDQHRSLNVIATPPNIELANNLLRRSNEDALHVDVITLGHAQASKTLFNELLTLAPQSRIFIVSNTPHLIAEDIPQKIAEAIEYLPAPEKHQSKERESYLDVLADRIKALCAVTRASQKTLPLSEKKTEHTFSLRKFPPSFLPKAIAIASSTGGPQALNTVFTALKGKTCTIPIFITQHMPAEFIANFAAQLGKISDMPTKQAEDKETVHPGTIYIAPGDHHMCIVKKSDHVTIALNQNPPVNFCRPAADPMLESIAKAYGHQTLVLVMTGMGSDGFHGAEKVIEAGGGIIAQDEATSVVWGMPGAVALGGLCSAVYPLSDIPEALITLSVGKIQ